MPDAGTITPIVCRLILVIGLLMHLCEIPIRVARWVQQSASCGLSGVFLRKGSPKLPISIGITLEESGEVREISDY